MRLLRLQVDQIDLKILKLLQQRTKLSRRIGKAKRLHQAAIYVPERERDLLARLIRHSGGHPPAGALEAIYREIFSSSRAAQGQPGIGLIRASAPALILPARWCFGACDQFVQTAGWTGLAEGLESGDMAVALLTGADLARIFQKTAALRHFVDRFTVIGDFPADTDPALPLLRRIFIVAPKRKGVALAGNRVLILIKCKSTANAVKTVLHAMPAHSIRTESLAFHAKSAPGLLQLTLARPLEETYITNRLSALTPASGLALSILGVYLGTEDYAAG